MGERPALAGALFGIETKVFMFGSDYEQSRRSSFISPMGATVVPSPYSRNQRGRQVLAADPDRLAAWASPSRGHEEAATVKTQVLDRSALTQSVAQTGIGQEAIKQMGVAGGAPDVVIGCAGGC